MEQEAIPGSVRIPLAELTQRQAEVPAGLMIIRCAGGWRSSVAASALRDLGHADVTGDTMAGGMIEWHAEGLPVIASLAQQD